MSDERDLAERTVREAYGASQVGPFDYCPKLGFREYWYPHLRWNVPVTEHDTRVWTFTLVRRPRTRLHAAWQTLWYHAYRKPAVIVATNEKEDLIVFKRDRINLERPQKLGPLDVGLIYFRRHLAQRARDYQRLGAARGALKPPPRPASAA